MRRSMEVIIGMLENLGTNMRHMVCVCVGCIKVRRGVIGDGITLIVHWQAKSDALASISPLAPSPA